MAKRSSWASPRRRRGRGCWRSEGRDSALVMCASSVPCMLTIRGAQGGGGLQHVELSWSVGTSSSLALIQASNDGSAWPLGGPGRSGESSNVGSVAQLSGYWIGDTHGHQLQHIPCRVLGTTGAWHDWCRGVHRPYVVHHAGGWRKERSWRWCPWNRKASIELGYRAHAGWGELGHQSCIGGGCAMGMGVDGRTPSLQRACR